ncbi:MAG TPA: FIVAR domain-containing protein, partial [Clostridiales bacterium]|nr:FIVAR domain-containing protein [Clostridiales bacterium]
MSFLLRIFSFLLSLLFTVNGLGFLGQGVQSKPEPNINFSAKPNAGPTPWQDEISKNSAKAAQVIVPPVIRVANAGYSLDNQALTASDCTTIQTSLIDYSARQMKDYDTTISVTVPAGASAPTLSATTQGLGNLNIQPVSQNANPYTWKLVGGNATAGNFIEYTVTYNLGGKTYTQKAASYIDFVELAAGWQTHVVRRNFSDVTHTRHEYTATLSGSASTGPGFAVYGHSGEGYYKMGTGGGSSGFVSNSTAFSGIKAWVPGYDKRENASIWYCGQPGKRPGASPGIFEDNIDGGHRAKLDVYYDPYYVGDISDLGIKLLYWRSSSPSKIPTLYQDKMIYKTGNVLFADGDTSDTVAKQYFQSTNAHNDRTQYINTNPGTLVFDFASMQLPPDGQQVTFASGIYGNFEQQVHLTTYTAWLITFHIMDKSELRALVLAEDNAFRQLHDGYLDLGGTFSAYLNKLTKAKAVLNQPNASAGQIANAKNELLAAINNLRYAPADYTQINSLVSTLYKEPSLYRPSPDRDPEYYYFGINYYPAEYYNNTATVQNLLDSIVYGLDSRYQTYINSLYSQLNSAWRNLELLPVDYDDIISYIEKASGLNDLTGSSAGNYIYANETIYPQLAGRAIYWRHFTTETYNNWDAAINGVVMGLKIPDAQQVADIENALRQAYNGLIIKPADYTNLNSVVLNAQSIIASQVEVVNPEGSGKF